MTKRKGYHNCSGILFQRNREKKNMKNGEENLENSEENLKNRGEENLKSKKT